MCEVIKVSIPTGIIFIAAIIGYVVGYWSRGKDNNDDTTSY